MSTAENPHDSLVRQVLGRLLPLYPLILYHGRKPWPYLMFALLTRNLRAALTV
jgi:hypothetical protein